MSGCFFSTQSHGGPLRGGMGRLSEKGFGADIERYLCLMIATRFPDLQWLKGQIARNFRERKGLGNLQLDSAGFPSVVINAKAREEYRPDIIGPISIFTNLYGESRCTVDDHTAIVNEEHYFISNRFQPYTLEIENAATTETFNIHIGEYFSEQFFAGVMQSSDALLNQGQQLAVPTVAFHNKLYRKDAHFNKLVSNLRAAGQNAQTDKLLFEEKMADILWHLLHQHRNILRQVEALPALKRGTKEELYRRLNLATDYIHASYCNKPELDEMAAAACLSKFHFLRLFKHVYHVSPYQYLQQLRMEKAEQLLKRADKTVSDIAAQLGFDNSNSFSRLFMQHTGVYPSKYRAVNN